MNQKLRSKSARFLSSPYSNLFTASFLGLAVVVASLWFSHSAQAIDPLRLHRKPFYKTPFAKQQARLPSASEQAVRSAESVIDLFEFGPIWIPLGPSPIPNGQTFPVLFTLPPNSPEEKPVSGRVNAIAVDPANPNIVYVGPAQGGVFRSLDGGRTWISLFLGAKNFAVGSITIDPKDHDKVIVGTGEGNFSGDSHFGVGIYVIEEATSWFRHLKGPFALDANGNNVLAKRAITQVLVDPKDDNVLFCTTSSAFGGLGAQIPASPPARGLYRSKNFRSGHPNFERLQVGPGTDTRVTSAVLDPEDPAHLVVSIFGVAAGTGGIYYTNHALDPVPTFTRAIITDTSDQNLPLDTNVKLAAARDPVSHALIVLAATSEFANTTRIDPKTGKPFQYIDEGVVRKSIDGGATFSTTLPDANGFAGGQGTYNIAIAIDQKNPANIYLAGTVSATGLDPDGGGGGFFYDEVAIPNPKPSDPVTDPVDGIGPFNGGGTFQYSNDGGATFVPSVNGLHADSHAVAIAPSSSNVVYTGNDGGVWKSTDGGHTWQDINTFGFLATQFESISVHPTDPQFTIGGTQDNGTIFRKPDGSFTRADFGDGGYALIDQSATDTENVTLYHTYFNQTGNLIGFGRVLKASCAIPNTNPPFGGEGQWSFMGIYGGKVDPTVHCDGTTDTFNGININDNVNFYAPMALGTGTPNTVYFGTDRLYRSTDRGTHMSVVSEAPILPLAAGAAQGFVVSAIGISPLSDNVRVVGLETGNVFATATGASGLVDVTGPLPAQYITRIVLSPNNPDVAYVAFNGYGLPPGQQVWKTTNLVSALKSGGTVHWKPAGSGIPDVSVNGLVIDPLFPNHLYAGTDIGVYASTNGGASWHRFGIGFPHVEVYDITLQSKFRILRAATHGLGFWQTFLFGNL
jgi:photosystem II stability/assembly factor-like uncharacterized protein